MLSFGEKLRQARLAKELTQKELANKLDVSNTVISNWEKNINRPDVDILEVLCGILDIEPNSLFNINANNYTYEETDLIQNFRKLDTYGKTAVNVIIDTELERVNEQNRKISEPDDDEEYEIVRIAARGGGITLHKMPKKIDEEILKNHPELREPPPESENPF